ncbi:MAG: hypothetical protein HRT88_01325 [Lentisphaeraceae bacterium]|nr:hypothetical protein [Lentisphaeraceae bacterium]
MKHRYPRLFYLLPFLTVDGGLCETQSTNVIKGFIEGDVNLRIEIEKIFKDEKTIWKDVLNNNETGEIFDAINENEALIFAQELLFEPLQIYNKKYL